MRTVDLLYRKDHQARRVWSQDATEEGRGVEKKSVAKTRPAEGLFDCGCVTRVPRSAPIYGKLGSPYHTIDSCPFKPSRHRFFV